MRDSGAVMPNVYDATGMWLVVVRLVVRVALNAAMIMARQQPML